MRDEGLVGREGKRRGRERRGRVEKRYKDGDKKRDKEKIIMVEWSEVEGQKKDCGKGEGTRKKEETQIWKKGKGRGEK